MMRQNNNQRTNKQKKTKRRKGVSEPANRKVKQKNPQRKVMMDKKRSKVVQGYWVSYLIY